MYYDSIYTEVKWPTCILVIEEVLIISTIAQHYFWATILAKETDHCVLKPVLHQ